MPVAFRKGVNSCKLVCIDVATGSPKVSRIPIRTLLGYNYVVSGDWPSGKAEDSGSSIGGSNPSSPAKLRIHQKMGFLFGIESFETPTNRLG